MGRWASHDAADQATIVDSLPLEASSSFIRMIMLQVHTLTDYAGISDRFFDKAVEVFCGKVNGKVLSMEADNTSYAMICGWDITDNKQGGQLDLGSYFKQGNDPNDTYNDHLFYLADPNPPLPSRNRFYSNLEPFVPNAEDTYTFDTFYDPCYEVHEGYGGDDFWFRDPLEWTAKGVGWKEHNRDKDDCVRKGGIYDKRGGTRDNDGRKDGQ
nr:hypothetical protein B0A51_09659 [Rachicladosporium sp. CCFEE 5018]